jgi:FkbM family methyltransferase
MESIRRTLRSILKPDSALYQRGADLIDFLSTIRTNGPSTWRILKETESGDRNSEPVALRLQNLHHPIFIRPGTDDAHTVINNIIRKEYDHIQPSNPPVWMIDAGAYIGDTSVYFLSRYPKLRIISLEPGWMSHQMAQMNLAPYGDRATLLQKGLYTHDGMACFSGDNTAASISEAGLEIDCVTISSLLEMYAIPRVNILKMDIEGAEEEIFLSKPQEWLNRVDLLIIEIHGARRLSLISRILSQNGFTMKQYRSVWYCAAK